MLHIFKNRTTGALIGFSCLAIGFVLFDLYLNSVFAFFKMLGFVLLPLSAFILFIAFVSGAKMKSGISGAC